MKALQTQSISKIAAGCYIWSQVMFLIKQFVLEHVILLNIKVIWVTANHILGCEHVIEQVRVIKDK